MSAAATQMGKKYEMTLWSLLLLLSSFFVSFFFREQHLCSAAAASSALLIPQTIFWSTTHTDLLEQFVR